MNVEEIKHYTLQFVNRIIDWTTSPAFYVQLGLVLLAVVIAYSLSFMLRHYSPIFQKEPKQGSFLFIRSGIY